LDNKLVIFEILVNYFVYNYTAHCPSVTLKIKENKLAGIENFAMKAFNTSIFNQSLISKIMTEKTISILNKTKN